MFWGVKTASNRTAHFFGRVVFLLWLLIFPITTIASPIFIDFEGVGEFNGSYAATTVNLSGLDWQIGPQALTGTLAGDMKNGDRAARLRLSGGVFGEITMVESKADGIGEVSFFASRSDFSGDRTGTAPVFELQYSGESPWNTWTTVGVVDLDGVDSLTQYTFSVNEPGDTGRLRFIQTGGAAGNRWNLDDIFINSAYAVTYEGNGNTAGAPPAAQVKNHDASLSLQSGIGSLEREGFSFTEWNTLPDGTGTSYAPGDTYTLNETLTLYAQWEVNEYTLTFNSAGGSAVSPITADFGTPITPPTPPTRTGFDFVAWSPVLPATMLATNQTHTALWVSNSTSTATTSSNTTFLEVSNRLSDSAPTVTSGHNLQFTVPTAVDINGLLRIDFPSEFSTIENLTSADVTISGVVSHGVISFAGSSVFVADTQIVGGSVVTVSIDEGVVMNPSVSGSYEIVVTADRDGGGEMSAATRVMIIEYVTVSAEVQTNFFFTITGVDEGEIVHGFTTTSSTTPNLVSFGALAPGVPSVLAQDLSVTTNAGNGFVITVESDTGGELVSSTGAAIRQFSNAIPAMTPTSWTFPLGVVSDSNTWSHWGITSTDGTLDSIVGGGDFSTGGFIALSGVPRSIFAHTGPADGTTQNIGQVRIGYKAETTSLQPAAQDYATNLTFIATPTF